MLSYAPFLLLAQPHLPNNMSSDLWAAVAAGDVDAARTLLQAPDVNVDAYNADGATLTYIAAAHGHTAMVELLADEGGADISKATPDDAKPLLVEAFRLDPPPQAFMDTADGGASPLFIAAYNGRSSTVRALVKRGANVHQKKNSGASPILATSNDGHTDIINFLVENGGNVNDANNDGITPVLIAAQNGHTAAIKLLIKHGADVHKPDNEGVAPVWLAAEKGHTDALHTLLKAGANARTAEWNGQPTLHIAAKNGHLPVVRVLAESWPLDQRPWRMFLMGAGALSELRDYQQRARSTRRRSPRRPGNFLPILYKPEMMEEIWKYLHKPRYVDPGQLDEDGRTAAQVATANGKEIVAALLQQLSLPSS